MTERTMQKYCFCADDELASQAKKKKAKTAKGRKEYIPNKGDANWVVVLMLLKVVTPAMPTCACCTTTKACWQIQDKSLTRLTSGNAAMCVLCCASGRLYCH